MEFHIEEFKGGNTRAYSQLYTLYQKALINFAVSFMRNQADAENMVQDAYTKVWLLRENFSGLKDIRAFLYIAVRNAAYDYLSHEEVKKKNERAITQKLQEQGTPEAQSEQIEQLRIEGLLLQSWEETAPAPVKDHHNSGKSAEEIGRAYNISGRTVLRMRERVINELRRRFGLNK